MRPALAGRPILCAVVDLDALAPDPHSTARRFFASGVDWIQLRDRRVEDLPLWEVTRALIAARDESNRGLDPSSRKRVIVNRRTDLVRAGSADGTHLGFDALPAETGREFLGPEALIGASLHAVEEVAQASDGVLDYCHLAPIWDPISKRATRPALGLERLAAACRTGLPVLAQGGLNPDHASDAVRVGAAGIAVTGILQSARSPEEAIGALRKGLDEGVQTAIP